MPYDYSRLEGLIVEKFGTQKRFSEAVGISEHSVSVKLGGKIGWKQWEIAKVSETLGISPEEIHNYFFKLKVQ